MVIDIRNREYADKLLSTYLTVLKLKSKSTQQLFHTVINNINQFGKINIHNVTIYSEDDIYNLLQEWIIWNNNRGITAASIACYLNTFRLYLRYCRKNFERDNIMHRFTLPRTLYENQMPLTPNIIKNIIGASKPEFKFQLLALISSGMRVRELGQIRLDHMDLSHPNIVVHIPAQITKTGRSRITFFSKQVSDMIRYRIKKNKKSCFMFHGDRTPEQFVNLILKRFATVRTKTNLMDKFDHCKQNRYKIHVHSLRAYFITRANTIQFGLGHILAGHNFYMKEYNQYTSNELLQMYKKFENNLIFRNGYNWC